MSTKNDVRLTSLGYLILYCKDSKKSVAFYRDVLGMKVKSDEPGWVELDAGQTTIALHDDSSAEDKSTIKQMMPVFTVDDIHETYRALTEKGVKFDHEPTKVCDAGPGQIGMGTEFRDLDGNHLSIFGLVSAEG